ncbi:MAG TPA: PAS domain-containing protein [Lysobacter sp.]
MNPPPGRHALPVQGDGTGERRRRDDHRPLHTFLLGLSDRLRPLADPAAIKRLAMDVLGRRMQVQRALYFDVDSDGETLRLGEAYIDAAAPMPPLLHLPAFGQTTLQAYRRGEAVVVDDVEADPRFAPEHRRASTAIGVRAAIGVPLLRGEELVALVAVQLGVPRAWTDEDVLLLREVAERTWASAERAAATAALRRSEARQAFLLTLSDALRPLGDAEAIPYVAAGVLGRHLGANRVAYAEHLDDTPAFRTTRNWVDGAEEVVGSFRYDDYGPDLFADLQAGRLRIQQDVQRDDSLSPAEKRALAAANVAAALNVPLVKNGRLVAFLGVNFPAPHAFGDDEIELVREVAERTWAAVERAKAEAKLRRSEQYFRALVTAGSYSIYRMSPDWRLMYRLDSETLASTDAPIENWIEKYIPASELPEVNAAIERAIGGRSLFELEHRVWLADGSIGWVVSRAVPLLDEHGEIVEWIGAGSNVTERRHAVEKLRDAEQRYLVALERQVEARTAELARSRDLLQATMDSSMDMIQVFEAVRDASGEIVDFRWILNNHTSEAIYGDVIGHRLLECNPGVIQEGIFEAFKRVVETGQTDVAERHYVHEQFNDWFYQSAVKLGDGVATTTKAIGAWKTAQAEVLRLREEVVQAQLRESEARSQGLVAGLAQASWETAADGTVVVDSPSWRALSGQSFEEMRGNGWMDAVYPEDRERVARHWNDAIARTGSVDVEARVRHAGTGGWRWTNIRAVPVLDARGTVGKWVGMNFDIHDRKLAEEAVRASEARLRNAVEVGGLGLWDWDIASGDVHWSDGHYRLQGYEVGEVVPSYAAWLARLHPDDREGTEHALRRAMELHEAYIHEFRVVHPDGGVRWLSGRGRFFYDDGRPVRMIGAMMDITERQEWTARQAVLIAELQHRTRNLMGVVRSMADKSIATSSDLADFRSRFRDRLDALARVQGLLSRLDEHDRVPFDELIHSEFAAVGGDGRLTLEGPSGIRLRSSTVQTLAMALHELATNAVKYGALGQRGAHLAVTWTHESDGPQGKPWLHIDWRETGVRMPPPRDAAAPGGGQGRELIEQALPYQLSARVLYELGEDGVHCRISLPVSRAPQTTEHRHD